MSFTSSDEHRKPVGRNEPLSPAPRPRDEADRRRIGRETRSDYSSLTSSRSRFDDMREEALVKSNQHPLEFQLARESRSPRVLPAVAGGIAAAFGVILVMALVFFNVFPKLDGDPSLAVSISSPASATAARATPRDTQALLQRFIQFENSQNGRERAESTPSTTARAKAPDNSQALLDKFVQWQQKTRDDSHN